jgi:AraC-like DNA-binding protein
VSPAGVYDHLTVTDDGDQAGFQTLSYLIFDQTIRVSVMQGSLNALFLRTFGWRERRI